MLGCEYSSAVTKKTGGADAGVRIYSSAVTKKTGGVDAGVQIYQCCDEKDWGCGCWGANIPVLRGCEYSNVVTKKTK